ncbi:aminopeptidase N [Thiohalomonas denitrificans]|uniref:Aminopeptidase N n=1 Tax=Thiohalomonas denitrificans TaxID=415747 RepID=A0A1G5Q6R3_9GAMM|nr:aminopeptidase N [Thiohalomonas denitrificans]SCZ57357.1 aminopeptidase N [Thiohalomonas denitrificans]
MSESQPQAVYLKDYTAPDYRIETINLRFDLDPEATTVTSRMEVRANYDPAEGRRPFVLNGQELELVSVSMDHDPVGDEGYEISDDTLVIPHPPAHFHLEVVTRINPSANTALEGLYVSGGNFCTQCEAEGFRKITYFPDRPDVMTRFTTTVVADRKEYPVLLSNGDRIDSGELEDGRHYVTWHDPSLKPSYLFALVAGDLACIADHFTTMSGKEVKLELYVQYGNEDKTEHAMRSLKKAMRWDEEVYGREYDLNTYMIVAVDDFNMGAMENKGLNIFNSRFILAKPETATDMDFVNIEGVIAHEYFHNWSGNRVTCRDWFQLSLKEGFTVFRDSQFTADMTSPAVKRIDDVSLLRTRQFAEDAGPMAHPIRPDSYVEINNFYTLTIYEKGAEVVRMIHTLLGPERFRKGSDLYFKRHDGQAVTTDDFVRAMEDANGVDLSRFSHWYEQAGTPRVEVERAYDAAAKQYRLTLRQSCPPTPGQPEKAPCQIPVKTALLSREGAALPLRLAGESQAGGSERVLVLNEPDQTFIFEEIPAEPVPSLLRAFSAPVKLEGGYSDEELAFLMGNETDDFNRWDAGQQLALRVIVRLIEGAPRELDRGLSAAFGKILADDRLDPALVAEALALPPEEYIAECMDEVDPLAIHEARQFVRIALAETHHEALAARYTALADPGPYRVEADAMGRRRLRNACLAYLVQLEGESERAFAQYEAAGNMTDSMAALVALVHNAAPRYDEALQHFYQRWHEDPLVLDKWFAVQAAAPAPGALERVRKLLDHPDFTMRNPNRVRSVIGAFVMRNPAGFHRDLAAYTFLADQIISLDRLNPQVAARMLDPLTRWKRYDESRRNVMKEELERILRVPRISSDVYEVVSKSLAA